MDMAGSLVRDGVATSWAAAATPATRASSAACRGSARDAPAVADGDLRPRRAHRSRRRLGDSRLAGTPLAPRRGRCAVAPPTSTDAPLFTTRVGKSLVRTSPATFTLRPIRDAARDDRPLADDGDAGVQPARLLAVRRVEVRPVADDRALADDDLLVEDRAVDDRARTG